MTVACPKCAERKDVGAAVPAQGVKVTCGKCGTAFLVRPPGTMAMASAARYFVRRKTGNSFGPFLEGVVASMLEQKKLDGTEEISKDGQTWAAITSVPAFAAALAKGGSKAQPPGATGPEKLQKLGVGVDLPAPREAVPKLPGNLPAPREAVPKLPGDLPAPREAVPKLPSNLPAPRAAVPKLPGDLPAPRGSVPKLPTDLPAPREAVPKLPGDLPAPRGAVPKLPTDLPAPREAVPRLPTDLPAPREAVPRLPTDLPAPREAVPRLPTDLPAPREAVGRPTLSFEDFTPVGARADTLSYGEVDLPAPRVQVDRPAPQVTGLDLPAPKGPTRSDPMAAKEPLDLGLGGSAVSRPTVGGLFPAGGGAASGTAEPEALTLESEDLDLGLGGPTMSTPSVPPPPPPGGTGNAAAGSPLDLSFGSDTPGAQPGGDTFQLEDGAFSLHGAGDPLSLATRAPVLPEPGGVAPTGAASNLGLDFTIEKPPAAGGQGPAGPGAGAGLDSAIGLRLDGSAEPAAGKPSSSASDPFGLDFGPSTISQTEMGAAPLAAAAPAIPDDKPDIEAPPPTAARAKAKAPGKKRVRKPISKKSLLLIGGIVVVLGGGGTVSYFVFDMFGLLQRTVDLKQILGPVEPALARDEFPAYVQAADSLEAWAAKRRKAVEARVAAARTLLESVVARGGEASRIARAEKALAQVPPDAAATPELIQARALLAVAQGRPKDAERDLGAAQGRGRELLTGWKLMGERKYKEAAEAFGRAAQAEPDRVVAHYSLARALELAGGPEAGAAYDAVLAKNPSHAGAAIARIRMADMQPAERIARAGELIAKLGSVASPAELAEAHTLVGRAARALDRPAEASAALAKAIAADPNNLAANLAMGESLLTEGRPAEALTRFQAAGAASGSTDAMFGLAGALIGTTKIKEGLALLKQASERSPKDARTQFWQARAAELGTPPDLDGAAQLYREVLTVDPKHLQASLQLAGLLTRRNQLRDALAVLKAAEETGHSGVSLQVALGHSLLASGDPARARKAFAKALTASPKLESARLGLIAAMEAGGELGEAKGELDKLLAESPNVPGLRERIGRILVKLGNREAALASYQAEIATGKATLAARVETARLALDIGKPEVARPIIEKVVGEDFRAPDALFVFARVLRAQGETANALQQFKAALAVEKRPIIHYEYGRTLAGAGKEEAAIQEYGFSIELPEARLERGRYHLRKGSFDLARQDLEPAVQQLPDNAGAQLLLGTCYNRLGMMAEAGGAWRAALRLDPNTVEALYELGKQEADRGRPREALDFFRRAAAKVEGSPPWEADLFFHLGEAEKLKGSKSGACAAFKKFLGLAAPDAPERKEAEMYRMANGCT